MIFSTAINYALAAIIVFVGTSVAVYFLLAVESEREREKKKSLDGVETMQGGHMNPNDPMQYVPKSDLSPPITNILVKPTFLGPKSQSVVRDDIKLATKGDGAYRHVAINGSEVPREYVKDAFFRNQDYMPRDEFPNIATPGYFDPEEKRQTSMFGPIKKMANGNGFGIDVMRQDSNSFINIAQLGGRYEE